MLEIACAYIFKHVVKSWKLLRLYLPWHVLFLRNVIELEIEFPAVLDEEVTGGSVPNAEHCGYKKKGHVWFILDQKQCDTACMFRKFSH